MMRNFCIFLTIMALLVGAQSVFGAPINQLTSRSLITGPGQIFWTVLGPEYSQVLVPFTTSVDGIPGVTATIWTPGTVLERRDQSSGWNGDFTIGEALLWNRSAGGPMHFTFSAPVSQFGTNIQRDASGPFTAFLRAYDASAEILGSLSITGVSGFGADGSTPFLGISSFTPIHSIELEVDGISFAINYASVTEATVVPEPASLSLVALGLGGMFVGAWLQRRSKNGPI